MASTPISLVLPVGDWVDLYDRTGLPRGSVLIVQNIGSSDVYLSTSTTQPAKDSDAFQVIQPNDFPMKNDGGDLGEWAFSPNQKAKINIRLF